jgi:hypothetical protein
MTDGRKRIIADIALIMRKRWLEQQPRQAGRGPDKHALAKRRMMVSDESYQVMGGVPGTFDTYAGPFPGFRITAADRKPPREVVVHENDYPPPLWPFPGCDLLSIQVWNAGVRLRSKYDL